METTSRRHLLHGHERHQVILISHRHRMFRLILFGSIFKLISSIQCTHNCSMNYSMTEPFVISSNCTSLSTYRCSVKLLFWYERGKYVVNFPGEFIHDHNLDDNRHFLMIETAKTRFFSYEINYGCKDQDDCAQTFAEKKIMEMTQRLFPITKISSELERVLSRKSHFNEDLFCFDSTEIVRQCAIFGTKGSCQIIDDLIKPKLHRRSCQRSIQDSASVNIYDSGSFAVMTVKCNRMLCNGPLTIQAVKKILYQYNITYSNGRLPGKTSRISSTIYLLIFVILTRI